MARLKRHFEDRHGIAKLPPKSERQNMQHGRSRTAGDSDFDETQVSRNQGHGHPRDERREDRG